MALSAAAAIAGIVSAGAGIYGTLSQKQSRGGYDTSLAQLRDAQNNAAYIRALNTLAIQQSRGGYTDSSGNEVYFDPTTNTWRSRLGQLPQQAQNATYQASVARNLIDLARERSVNEQSMAEAARAGPAASSARLQYENFRPMTGDTLGGLLRTQVVNAQNTTNQPLIAEALRESARSGQGAGTTMAAIQKQSADNVRDAIIQSTISGMTGVDEINAKRQGVLAGNYQAMSGMTHPSLQSSQVNQQDPNQVLASMATDKARVSTLAPLYGMSAQNQSQALTNESYKNVAGAYPNPNFDTNKYAAAGNQLGSLFEGGDKSPIGKFLNLFGKGAGGASSFGDSYFPMAGGFT